MPGTGGGKAIFREQYGALSVPRAAEVCKHLLGKASANGAVVEDLAKPAGKRILTSGFTAFINPEWLRKYMGGSVSISRLIYLAADCRRYRRSRVKPRRSPPRQLFW
jgi:hypothetical protein